MPITNDERMVRNRIQRRAVRTPAAECETAADIRAQAIAAFTAQLDGKIANLQVGERLAISLRFDIVMSNGRIRGGSGSERNMPEYIQWRKAVYERDGYTCRECGDTGRLNAHHVKPWATNPELRFDVDNGVTLCLSCHRAKHPHIRSTPDG